jgi:autotransporter-associated beta strand protein
MFALLILGASTSRAATLYWDGGGLASNNWATLAGWDTLADGTGGNPAVAPGINDIAVFNTTALNNNILAALSANVTISGLVFNSTGTTAIRTTGANRRMFIGEGGILVNAGAGTVTFGITTDAWRIPMSLRAQTLGSTQSWINNSGNLLSFNANNTVISTNALGAWVFGGSGDISMGGVISGSGTNILKTGSGVLTLAAANTYAGTTGLFTLTEGRVRIGNDRAFSNGRLVLNGGTLSGNNSTTARSITNDFTVGGDVTLGHATDSAMLTLLGAGTLTGSRAVTVDSAVVLSGAIGDGGGVYSLTKTGSGLLTLAGANTYSGGTTVEAGALALRARQAQPGTGTIAAGAGAGIVLGVNDGDAVTYWTTGDIDSLWSGGLANFSLHADSPVGIDTSAGDVTYATAQSTRGLVKAGTNTLTVTGDSTYSGGTVIHNGVLQVGNGGTSGTLGSGDVLNNATLTVNRADSYTIPGAIGGTGVLLKSGAGTLTLTNSVTQGNAILVSAGTLILSNATVTSTANVADYVGRLAGDSGVLRIEGSTVLQRNQNNLILGGAAGSTGVVVMTGGVLTNAGILGVGNGGVGSFIQTGGIINNAGEFDVAYNAAGTYGYYQMSGGALTNNTWLQAGRLGLGLVYQDGGSIRIAGNGVIVGSQSGVNSTGVLYQTGGTMITPSIQLTRTAGSRGEYAIDGTADVTVTGNFELNHALGTNIASLMGGTLTANQITKFVPGGLSILNFDGGTLRARQNGHLIATGASRPDYVNVYADGATLDDGGFLVTNVVNLTAPAGDGVLALDLGVASLGGFVGAPYVSISGGGGEGATAVALFDHLTGSVTGLVVTSRGFNYSGEPTVTLVGGGSTNVPVSTVTVGANTSGALTKAGAGTLWLLGTNTYTGGTFLNNGTLGVTNDLALGAAGTALTFDGGALQPGVAMTTIDRPIVLTGAGTLIGSAAFTRSITGNVSGAGTLTFTGGGTNILSGHNPTLSGGVTVNDGRLVVTGSSPAGGGAPTIDPLGTGTVTLNGGALAILDNGDGTATAHTFQYDNDIVVNTASTILVDRASGSATTKTIRMDQLTANANRVLFTNGNSYVLFFGGSGGASTIGTNVTVDVPASTVQIGNGNSLTGTGTALTDGAEAFGLTKTGAGNLTLGKVDIGGALTVNAGTLQLNNVNSVIPGGIVINAGTLLLNAANGVMGAASSPDAIVNGGTLDIRNTSAAQGVGFDVVGNATMALKSTGDSIFAVESVAIEATATAFTLNVNRPSGSNTGKTLTLNGPVTTTGPLTFNVTGGNSYIAAISGAVASVSLGGDITFNPSSAPLIVSPGITDGGSGYALTKSGTGLLTLNGTNRYSGATTILNGTLALGPLGSISNSPSISIAAGKLFDVSAVTGGWTQWVNQTVSGTGSIRGNATVLQGRIEPGASPGTLTYSNNLSLTDANVEFELAGVGTVGGGVNDLVDVKGNLALTGVSTNIIVPWDGPLASSYTLFTYGGTLTGGAGNLLGIAPGVRAGYTFTFDTLGTPGSIIMNVGGAPASQSLTWAAGSGAWDVATTASWAGGEKFYQLDSVTFDNSGAVAGVTNAVAIADHVTPGGIVVNSDRDYSLAGAGEIGGTGGLTKDGAGLLILGTSNTFNGATAILDGRVVLGHGYALQNSTVSNAVANGLGFSSARSVILAGLTGAGDIALTNEAAQGVSLTVGTNGASTTFGGALNDQGLGGSLTKVGAGTLTLTGAVNVAQGFTNYAGTVVFGATGTNSVGSDVRLGYGAGSSATVVQNAGTVIASGGNALLLGNVAGSGASGTYVMNGGTLIATPTAANRGVILGVNQDTTGTLHLVDGVVTGKILQVTRSDATAPRSVGYYFQSGGTAGFANVTVAGGSAANSATNYAVLAVSNGTFMSTAFGGLASGNYSTGLVYFGQGARVTLPAFPTARGTDAYAELTMDGGTLSPLASSAAYMQNLTRAYLTANGGTLDVGAGLAIIVTQAFENAGLDAGTLRKTGIGTLLLAGANTFSGGATVSNGVLSFASPSAMPAGGTVTGLAGAAVGLGVGGAGSYVSADVDSLWAGTMAGVTLEAGALVGIDTSAGNFTYETAQATRGLAKAGTGTLILTGANTFNGGIVLYNGTLNVSNDTVMGASGSGLTFRGGVLQTSGDMTFDDRAVTLEAAGTFSPDAATTLTITNAIGGTGALVKSGAGRLVLTGASTYSGGTTGAAGVLALGGDNVLGNGTLVLSGGALASDSTTARALTNAVRITGATTLGDVVNNGALTVSGLVDFAGAGRSITNHSDVTFTGSSGNGGFGELRGPSTLTFQGGVHDWQKGAALWVKNGSLVFDGAVVTNADAFRVGSQVAYGTSRFVVTNGAVLVSTNASANIRVGYTGGNATATNILDVAGRITMNASGTAGKLQMGEASAHSIVNLRPGGEIEVALVSKDASGGLSEFNFDGGILRAMEDSATFMTGLDAANVMAGGAVFDVQTYNITVGQPLQGVGGLTKLGTGVLTLSGTNTYAGGTAISAGALSIASTNAMPGLFSAGSYAVSNGVVFAIGNAVTEAEAAAMLGTGNFLLGAFLGFDTSAGTRTLENSIADTGAGALGLAKVGSGTLVITNANGYTGGTWIYANGALQVGDGGTSGTLGGGAVLANGALVFDRSDAYALANVVSGTGTLTQAGTGTLNLNVAQLYTGATTVRQGTVTLGIDNALPTGTSLVLGQRATAGTLDLGAYNQTMGSLGVSSTNSVATNTITVGVGQTLAIAGALTVGLNSGTNSHTHLRIEGGGSLVVTNAAANVSVGVGQNANNTYSAVASMDLSGLASVTLGGSGSPINELRVGYGQVLTGTLTLSDTNNLITATTVQIGNSLGANAGPGTLILGAGANVIAADTINIGFSKANATVMFRSQAAGSPGFVVITGMTGVAADLVIGNKNGTGTAGNPVGTLDLRGHLATVTANNVTLGRENGNSTGNETGNLFFDAGTFTVSNLNMAAKSTASGSTASATLTVGGGVFTVNPGGSFTLASQTGGGSANGTLNILGGLFDSNVDIRDGGGNATSTLTLNGGTLDMQGNAIGSAAAAIDVVGLYAGTLRNVSEINGGGPLTKSTAGTLTIEGNNAYAGSLTVAEGTLRYNGSYTGGGLITVQGGATLMGTGSLAAVTVEAGGAIRPGNSAGTLTVGDLTLDGGALLEFELGTSSDLILAGATTLGGVDFDNFTFLPGVGFGPGVYTLIDATGISGLGAGTTGTVGSYDAALSIDDDGQDLVLTVIPEPTTLGLLGLCAAAALLRRRLRRH